ncbi:hypothetical protein BaRGS_00016355 [Batillaria attramentaria]|uniref:SCAN box domain-containing protein n=1 Tax=Batillaria attramentaria TaxID=370345 RepID=A0ABD0KZ18_9CAEN
MQPMVHDWFCSAHLDNLASLLLLLQLLTVVNLSSVVRRSCMTGSSYDQQHCTGQLVLTSLFQCTEEGFRKQLRSAKPETGESFPAFYSRLKKYLARWMELSQTAPNDDPLLDLFTREQILQSCHKDLATVLKEKCVTTADEMIEFAEVYREAHPSKPVAASPGNGDVFLRASSVAQETDNAVPRGGSTAGHATRSRFRGGRRGGGGGWYKVSDGHWARDCPGDDAAILTASRADYTAQLLICDGKISSVPGRVLRDTGFTTVGVRKSLVPHDSYTQELIKCVTFGGHIQTFPVTEIDI